MFKPMYCVIIQREFDDDGLIRHYAFMNEPTRQEVIDRIHEDDIEYDDNYGAIDYYKIGNIDAD